MAKHECRACEDHGIMLVFLGKGKGWVQLVTACFDDGETDLVTNSAINRCPYCGARLMQDGTVKEGEPRYKAFGTGLVLGTKSNGNSLIYGGDYPVPFRTDWVGVPRLTGEEPGKRYAVLLEELPEWAERWQ